MNKFLLLFQVHTQFVAFRLVLDIARLGNIAVAIAIPATVLGLLTGGARAGASVDDNHSGTALFLGLPELIAAHAARARARASLLLLLFAVPRKGGIGHHLVGVPP